jgi:serine/threonine-protein kinase
MGTAAYVPEQAGGKAATAARRWVVRAVLYQMLSGKARWMAICPQCWPPPKLDPDWSACPLTLPHPSVPCCGAAADRKQRLQAIVRRIAAEETLSGLPRSHPNAVRPPSIPRWRQPRACHRRGIGWWTAWRTALPANHPLLRLSVDLGPDAEANARVNAAISPDGSRLVFPVRGPSGTRQLATRLLDQPQITLLSGTEAGGGPFFSPDGQWIGFFTGRQLKKVSIRGGGVLTVCDAPDGRGAAWGEDDNIIATLNSGPATGLSRISAAGGTPQELTHPGARGEATDRWPQILPGGQAVLFMSSETASNYDDASIQVHR